MCAPKTGGEGRIFEIGAALVVIERRRVSGEIRFDDVEIAVQIVVGGGDAHARLRLAVGTERASRFDGDIFEFSVLLVLVKRARRGIVGHVDIGPAIVVEICSQHAEAVSAVRAQNS